MASQGHCSLLPTLFILSIILLLGGKASGGRIIHESSKEADKEPEWFFGSHGSIPIPGIGHVPLPHFPGGFGSFPGSSGGSSGSSGGATGSSGGYIPGGDDTFIPNPGVEIPNPGGGGGRIGGVPMTSHP